MQLAYQGASADSTSAMEDALRQWIAAGPADVASVVERDEQLLFTSCDPGTTSTSGTDRRALVALGVPAVRAQAIESAIDDGGVGLDDAWKYGECVSKGLTYDDYVQLDAHGADASLPDALEQKVEQAFSSCTSVVGG